MTALQRTTLAGRFRDGFRFSRILLLAAGFAIIAFSVIRIAAGAPSPEPIDMTKGCTATECHGSMTKSKFLHGPMNLNECEPCHVAQDNQHVFEKPADDTSGCLLCHETEAPKESVHRPFEEKCELCHDPHGGDNRYFVLGGPGAEGCNRCHDDVREGLKKLHGPTALGECLACHSPHQADNANLLVDPPRELCLACHDDYQERLEGAVSIHEPAVEGCSGCHNAHGGQDQFFLVGEGKDLCKSCHEDFLLEMEEFEFSHMPMAEGKACSHCHDPHTSNQEKLLAMPVGDLCLSCHDKPIESGDKVLSNIADQIANAKYLHGPLEQKNCNGCHEAHGSNYANLLDKAFPTRFYAKYAEEEYNLCYDCHDAKLASAEKGKDTEFRNGDQNLHFLHVNREKGRSCRACHHEHASHQPNLLRSETPFGRWTMKMEFTKTDNGGGCLTGCHLPYKYDRESPVDNSELPI